MKTNATLTPIYNINDLETAGVTLAMTAQMKEFFETTPLSANITLSIAEARTEDGDIIEEFESVITGRFRKNGDLHAVVATGDVVNITGMIRGLEELIK